MKTTILLAVAIALGQVGPPPVPSFNGKTLLWDHDGLDVLGNAENISHFVISATDIGSTSPASAVKSVDVPNGLAPKELVLDPFFLGLRPGNYKLWVEVVDVSGNRSVPSPPLSGQSDLAAPTAATNARLRP